MVAVLVLVYYVSALRIRTLERRWHCSGNNILMLAAFSVCWLIYC